ncbi:HNH endonuclease [Novosphingobium album (ex Liu et al. 2023)]|uniref:HNH endonuclease n=1 Tax=Novosphingobium album (ex Liu et al. 2023) TaxID=3031130 RepID=A0ABT5WW58_9SPHN|nr:HNH endonuclease [Novosphingobium album (ex Liu et al. 2023)]MDE8654098.1 HNH endonuclease [Novosphingobium album (ex Liu et al. 2023)]
MADTDRESGPGERPCWLCARPLGRRIEWHHPVPKSRGGRETVPLHPICHRAIHANFTNAELTRKGEAVQMLREHAAIARFIAWVADKPPDFHARTAAKRR